MWTLPVSTPCGSWIYIGTQGILQGTYETFAEGGRADFGGTLKGKLCVTAGCGGMGGAQPLAVTLAEGTCLIADVDLTRLKRRLDDRYLDEIIDGLDNAIDRALELTKEGKAVSVGVHANAVELLERLLAPASLSEGNQEIVTLLVKKNLFILF